MPQPSDWTQDFFSGPWLPMQLEGYPDEKNQKEARFIYEILELKPGSKVLDVPCGEGRIALELAQRGCEVTGVDFNAPVVDAARAKAAQLKSTARFIEGDMRKLAFDGAFDAVVNWFGSFGYFDDATNQAVAAGFARALQPGGKLIIEGHVLETILPKYTERSWSAAHGAKVLEERAYDPTSGRIESTWTWIKDGVEQSRQLSMRMYSFHELAALLKAAGFAIVEGYETLTGKPLKVGSNRCTVLARK